MYSIGEFSRIARVTARQLRHYEELGVFQPEHVDPETGYRYYSALQLPRLDRILALKDLGLTLAQIVRLLDEDLSVEELRGMLTIRKAQIEQTLQGELLRIRNIEARLRQIEEQDALTNDVLLKALPEQPFLSIRQVVPSIEQGFALMATVYRSVSQNAESHGTGNFAVVLYSESFSMENIDVEMGFLLPQTRADAIILPDGRAMTMRMVPVVATMATVVCVGFASHDGGYGALGTWVEQHDLRLAGPSWEVFIEPFHPTKLDEAVIEVRLPVIRNAQDASHPLLTR